MSTICCAALHNWLPVMLLLALGCCSSYPSPMLPSGPATIDPTEYLVQSKNCDGNVETPLLQRDEITCRRFDFGHHQAGDAFLMPDGSAIQTWSYPPFGPWHCCDDGGERLVIEYGTTRIDSTQDGGKPGIVQFFVGLDCGGTGWVAFRNDATLTKKSLIARLTISNNDPNGSNASNSAYTRYWVQDIDYPKLGRFPSVVGEHYAGADPNTSGAMERFFWARGWGRLVWQAWGRNQPLGPELGSRCPDFDGFNTLPFPGLHLYDCREVVNVEPADGILTGAELWHPRRLPR